MNRFPVENIDKVAEAELADSATTAQTANKANQLSNAKTVQVNLASTSSVNFDGSSNITPGITGVLPINNGGTGSNTKNFVDLTSVQEIAGNKAFKSFSLLAEDDNNEGGSISFYGSGSYSSIPAYIDRNQNKIRAHNGSEETITIDINTKVVRIINELEVVGTLKIPGGQIWIT